MIGCTIKFKVLPGRRFKVEAPMHLEVSACSGCAFIVQSTIYCKAVGAYPACYDQEIVFKEVK